MAFEGIADEGRALLLQGLREGKVIAATQRLLDRRRANAERFQACGDLLGLNIIFVTFAEKDVVTDYRGLVVAQRIVQPRLDAAWPGPMAQLGDALVVDRGDYDRTGQRRAPRYRHPEIGGLQIGQLEDSGMEPVEDEERGQNDDPDKQRAPYVPVAARSDSCRRGHRGRTIQSLARCANGDQPCPIPHEKPAAPVPRFCPHSVLRAGSRACEPDEVCGATGPELLHRGAGGLGGSIAAAAPAECSCGGQSADHTADHDRIAGEQAHRTAFRRSGHAGRRYLAGRKRRKAANHPRFVARRYLDRSAAGVG